MFRGAFALLTLLFLCLVGGIITFVAAGRGKPPTLAIDKPERMVGQATALEVTAGAPNGRFTSLNIAVEQGGKSYPLYALGATQDATVTKPTKDQMQIARSIGKQSVPQLQAGPARLVVTATRPSFLSLRSLTSSATKDIQVRLEPPRIAVLSTHHYVNHGGSEMVVYRATPADVISGVRVGDIEYPGFPASGAGATSSDPALKLAFFALLYNQDLHTPIVAFARDESGASAKVDFVDNVFEKPFKKSRIELDDRFIDRVVPEIIEHSPAINLQPPAQGSADMLPDFLKLNGDLRKINAKEIAALDAKTSPTRLWQGPFVQLGNSQVEARFADERTYIYKGKEVDHQVHLGFDLAVTRGVQVVAANAGTVLNASWLGIYGNCVILDHGMGVQSLYGHLSSFDVNVGDKVSRGQTIGRSGMTGLAGGDHLHFTMLVGGQMVNPVEWWDSHWITDRVDRKVAEVSNPPTQANADTSAELRGGNNAPGSSGATVPAPRARRGSTRKARKEAR